MKRFLYVLFLGITQLHAAQPTEAKESDKKVVRLDLLATRILNPQLIVTLKGILRSCPYNPDGSKFITTSNRDLKNVCIHDALTGKTLQTLCDDSPLLPPPMFDHQGKRVITLNKGFINIWNSQTGELMSFIRCPNVSDDSLQVNSDSSTVYVHGKDTVDVIDLSESKARNLYSLTFKKQALWTDINHKTSQLVTVFEDNTLCIIDTSGEEVHVRHTLKPEKDTEPCKTFSARFSPDGSRILSFQRFSLRAFLWDSLTGKCLAKLQHDDIVDDTEFNSNGSQILSFDNKSIVKIWNSENGAIHSTLEHKPHLKLPNTFFHIASAHFSPDSSCVVTACTDKTVRIWSLKTNALIATIQDTTRLRSAFISPTNSHLLTFSGFRGSEFDKKIGRTKEDEKDNEHHTIKLWSLTS